MMDLSSVSLLEWSKLFVRDPRLAVQSIKAANLPLDVSVMIIGLAGILWAILSGLFMMALDDPRVLVPISETEAMSVAPVGPILQGIFSALFGVGMGYCLYRVGARVGGQGSLLQIMSSMAVLEFVVALFIVAQVVVSIIAPVAGLFVFFAALFVLGRGLAHVVNEGHAFEDMGKSAWVAVAGFGLCFIMTFAFFTVLGLLGVSAEGEIVPYVQGLPNEI